MTNLARSMDPIHADWLPMHRVLIGSLEAFTDFCGDTNRAKIVRRNQADDVINVCGLPRPLESRQRRLGRKSVSPPFAVEYPAEINTGHPSGWYRPTQPMT